MLINILTIYLGMADVKKLQPIGGFILVKPATKEEKTASGLILQSSDKEKPQKGEVVALGTGLLDEHGKVVPFNVKVGQTVLFKKYAPEDVEIDGEEFLIMKEVDILAVVNK